MCWNSSTYHIANRSEIRYAIAVVGDSTWMFMKSAGKNTTTTVSECMHDGLTRELQNSALRDFSDLGMAELANKTSEQYLVSDFVLGGGVAQFPPACKPEKSFRLTSAAAQRWLEAQREMLRHFLVVGSNDARLRKRRADLKYYEGVLAQSPYYRSAQLFRETMTATPHMIVMVGTGSSDTWKLSAEWEEASIKLS
jgi:hypothetical protein